MRNQEDKIYYIVYKTTNLINEKIYIGVHQTTNLNDEYLGSGTKLKEAFKKYGIENFKKEILYIFDNELEMFSKEKEIVNENFIKNRNNYNIAIGGHAPPVMKGENNPMYGITGEDHPLFGRTRLPETKLKIGKANSTKLKGKSWEEILGVDGAKDRRKKQTRALKGKPSTNKYKGTKGVLKFPDRKGKTYDELFDPETAIKMKEFQKVQGEFKRGKTVEEIHGYEKGQQIRNNISKSNKGKEITEETRNKISKTLTGNKLSKESIAKRTETRRKNGWNKRNRN